MMRSRGTQLAEQVPAATAPFKTWFTVGSGLAFGVLVIGLAATFVYVVRSVLIIVLVSVIFAQAIAPVVLRLRRFGAKRAYAVLTVYILTLLLLAGIVWLVAQAVIAEYGQLVTALPEMRARLYELIEQMPASPVREGAVQVVGSSSQPANTAVPAAISDAVLKSVLSALEILISVFTVFVITFYWIQERLIIRRVAFGLLAPEQRQRATHIWDDVEEKLGAWVRGQLTMMLTVGIAFAIGLTLLGVEYALPLAVFAAVVEIVPFVGAYIATALPVLVALTQSTQLGLTVAGFGILVQLIEGNVLVPRILGKAVGISHLTVILGLLVGGALMGLAGALLAVPVAAAIQVILVDLNVFAPKEQPPGDAAVVAEPPLPVQPDEAQGNVEGAPLQA